MEKLIWLGLMIGFLIIEAACPIHLVSVWFAAGALAALIASLLGGALWLQAVLFALCSLGLLAGFWPLTKKFLNPKVTSTNVDALIGTQGRVTEEICNHDGRGQVKLGGMEWTARSESGETIPRGADVQVVRIEGVKVFVKPV